MLQNCLECKFGEVPLSIQKGYSVLLHPDHGCSLHEYRVFSHLCLTGYRVARHCADLTATAYERKIRLDQHLDQKRTFGFTTPETELPRPDLPPKTVISELPEDTEISLESRSVPLSVENNTTTEDVNHDNVEAKSEMQPVGKSVEVIDLLDSSDESSSDESSSSDDSDIQIVHETAPNIRNKERNDTVRISVDDDSESDIEIIDVPAKKKEILVETIETSSSDSDSGKSHDGNWKRKPSNKKKSRYQRPSLMSHFTFLNVREFCAEDDKNTKGFQSISVDNNETVNKNSEDPECNNFISIDPISIRAARPKFIVENSRNEVLDQMPSMGGLKRKLISIDAPDLRLIPENIVPRQSYTFSTNSLKARVFRPGFRGRFRGFRGQNFGNYNSYNNTLQSFYPNQINSTTSFTPNTALAQMFGSDTYSMARGMMQFASSLLLNLPQNNLTNSLLPYSQQPQANFNDRPTHYSQHGFRSHGSPNMHHDTFEGENSRFPNSSSYNSFNSNMDRNPQQFGSNSSYPSRSRGNPKRFQTPYSRSSDTDFRRRNFTPPPRRANVHRRGSYIANRNRSRIPFRRGARVDPAFMKPDVPLSIENVPEERTESFILSDPDEDVEIVKDVCKDIFTHQRGKKKRRRKLARRMLNKRMRLNSKVNPEIIFLDSPSLSNASSADLVELKAENIENDTSDSTTVQHLNVKQESSGDSLTIKKEQTPLFVVKNELSEINVKSERSNEISIKSEEKESQVAIKMEIPVNNSAGSTAAVASLVKSESNISFKLEPNVKCEENGMSKIKDESNCQSQGVTLLKPVEINEIKNENLSHLLSENNVERTVNAAESQKDKEDSEEASVRTSSVIKCEVPESTVNQNNVNHQQFSNEMEVDEPDQISNNSSETTRNSNKNRGKEKNETSLNNVSSWAEVKKHNIPISSLPESISDKEGDSDDEDENDSDDIKPLIRPKHCKSTGNYDSFYIVDYIDIASNITF